jgi:hypothetical protein
MADELVSERRYSSRKFLMACSIIVAGHIALGLDAINSAEWLDLMKWTAGLYFAGNVGTWLTDALRAKA